MITRTHQHEPQAYEAHSAKSLIRGHGTDNECLASRLTELADLLAEQGANKFRVEAYRHAATTISELGHPVRSLIQQQGMEGLIALPTIGASIANLIEQYLRTDHIPLLDRLRGEESAERLFGKIPGLGPELSRRIHEQLEIETLPELYAAAGDGRLQDVPGIGSKRAQAIHACVAEMLRQPADAVSPPAEFPPTDTSIPVAELLSIDAEYRRLARENKLIKIAPRRFNPGAVAWLPILHTDRADRHYTALFSNTARAHELNTTHDWVVIYRDDTEAHQRWTVITSQFGKQRGYRIVRGREPECLEYWTQAKQSLDGDKLR